MKTIKHRKIEIRYPVGSNMQDALDGAREYSKILMERFSEEITKAKRVVILCRGSSGAILGALLCVHFRELAYTYIVHIKKQGETTHGMKVDGIHEAYKNDSFVIVVDDFIDTGETILKIVEQYVRYHHGRVIKPIDAIIVGFGAPKASYNWNDHYPGYVRNFLTN